MTTFQRISSISKGKGQGKGTALTHPPPPNSPISENIYEAHGDRNLSEPLLSGWGKSHGTYLKESRFFSITEDVLF